MVFLLLHKAYEKPLGRSVVKMQLGFGGDQVPADVADARCSYSLYNRDTLEQIDDRPATLLKEGAGLVFYVESNNAHDLIRIDLETPSGGKWQSSYHGLHVTLVAMEKARPFLQKISLSSCAFCFAMFRPPRR